MSQPGPATGNSTLPSLPGRILGIDAGGSGTRVILLENGTVTARPDGPPMNALLTDGFAGHLRQIIEAADATAAGVGMAGVRQPGQARDLGEALTRQTGRPVHVTGDADSARAGAFLGAPGVVVIAGTGSMASGWNGESSARAGGHGFLLGDEGSAYWIGRAAVRAALRWEDGMGGSKIIHRAVIQAAGQDLDALIGEVCTHPAERARLTALAPVVTALAAEDPEARTIALRAAEHLAALAEAIRRRLGPLPVAGAGRVFSAPVIWDRFAELTGAVRPLAAATVGAALLAGQPARKAASKAASVPVAPERQDRIGALLDEAVGDGGIPGAVAAVGQGPVTLGRWATGQADAIAGRPMQADTVFDLASLTKVVATTTVTLALAGRGELGLGDPVAAYLPAAAAGRDDGVTVARLLTHTAGLPGSRSFYRWCGSRARTAPRPPPDHARAAARIPKSPTPIPGSCCWARWWRPWRANLLTPPSAAW